MSEIEIRSVRTAREKRVFMTFPWKVYQDDPLWVPPLLPERSKVIDPKRGVFFDRGKAEFFIAWRSGKPVGTIMAAEDPPTNQARGTQECMFGFFECVNDAEVAVALFETAKDWAKKNGLNALLGPFNLDYEDGYGILVRGRDRAPALMCGHTPTYYQKFVEDYGFVPARPANLAFAIDLTTETEQYKRMSRLADRLRARGRIHVRGANYDDWDCEIDRVHYLLTHALGYLEGGIPWRRDAFAEMVAPFKRIADPELVLLADIGDQTVGFFPGVPNLNEVFIRVNGLRYPWNYLQLLWYMRKQPECLAVKSVLVLPEYWNKGVAVLLFDEMRKRAIARGYTWADMSITSENNPNTIPLTESFGAQEYKRWQVYTIKL
jgi:GNAT superfamily N-acetyltransferase